jgi:crotonobetainyl-CoA:carnitine CoA-transferase CaiB-like acyl-CoA transferase
VELEAVIAPILAKITREEAIAFLSAAGIACGRLSDIDDLLAHPQRRLISVETPAGEVEMLAPGAKLSGAPESYGAVPTAGEHTEALRKEFGTE